MGITAGSPHTFKFAQAHSSQSYPAGVRLTAGMPDPSQGGSFSSSRNWQCPVVDHAIGSALPRQPGTVDKTAK